MGVRFVIELAKAKGASVEAKPLAKFSEIGRWYQDRILDSYRPQIWAKHKGLGRRRTRLLQAKVEKGRELSR
jgi:hypothetical protein